MDDFKRPDVDQYDPDEVLAVVITESTTIPGDERSRTHPGHGYPEHTVENQVFKEFKDRAQFEAWIKDNMTRSYGRQKFQAYICKKVKVELKTEIKYS